MCIVREEKHWEKADQPPYWHFLELLNPLGKVLERLGGDCSAWTCPFFTLDVLIPLPLFILGGGRGSPSAPILLLPVEFNFCQLNCSSQLKLQISEIYFPRLPKLKDTVLMFILITISFFKFVFAELNRKHSSIVE